ncbi:MAG: SIR2 family protein [Nitrospirae bacterium]|nr:SIR2 family protein [Nitrospirota bacterium]
MLKELTPNPFFNDTVGHLKFNPQYNSYLKFLNLFIKDDKKLHYIDIHKDTIISFNYDLVFEATASLYNWNRRNKKQPHITEYELLRLNITFGKENISIKDLSDFFTGGIIEDRFQTNALSIDTEQSIKLIKLHGSINWQGYSSNESFIIPPTWNKSDIRVRKLWEAAYNELKEAKRIIILGYSLPQTDTYVESLLALALNENKILQNIFFINPDNDRVKSRCVSLLDKYFMKHCEYKEWTFNEFMNSPDGEKFIEKKLNRYVHNIVL